MFDVLNTLSSLPQLMSLHEPPEKEEDFNLSPDILNIESNYISVSDFQHKKYNVPTFSFLNYNIRSLKTNYGQFTDMIQNCQLDLIIILITEPWLSENCADVIQIPSYTQSVTGCMNQTICNILLYYIFTSLPSIYLEMKTCKCIENKW